MKVLSEEIFIYPERSPGVWNVVLCVGEGGFACGGLSVELTHRIMMEIYNGRHTLAILTMRICVVAL